MEAQWVVRKEEKETSGRRPAGECTKTSRREVGEDLTRVAEPGIISIWDPSRRRPQNKDSVANSFFDSIAIVSLKGDPRKLWLGRGKVRQGKKGRR